MTSAVSFFGPTLPLPTLDLRFAENGSLVPSITFTRATSAWYFNSAGVLTDAGSGNPRFDYDPSTLAARGLLIEEARTNLCLQSEDLATTWSNIQSTETTNAINSPDGTQNADKIVEDATAAVQHGMNQDVTAACNVAYAMSCFAKAGERTWFRLTLDDGTATNAIRGWFDLANGVVGSAVNVGTGAGAAVSIQSCGNGWYRCTLTGTPATVDTGTTGVRLRLATGDASVSYNGDGVSGLYAWGADLEAGAFSTSYIKTTTAAATRNTDDARINTLTPWFNANEGTLFVEAMRPQLSAAQNNVLAAFSDGSSSDRMGLHISTANVLNVNMVGGADSGSANTANTISANVPFKAIAAFGVNNLQGCLNSTLSGVDATSSLPADAMTHLRIGALTGGLSLINGWVMRVAYYPRRLPAAQLQALTA